MANSNSPNRRDFVKQVGSFAVGSVMSLTMLDDLLAGNPNALLADKKPKLLVRNKIDTMSYIPLGRTNLLASRLSLGGVPWEPAVVRRAISQGVNLIHGSNGYGTMKKQAETLTDLWDKFWFVLKQGTPETDMAQCVEKCLKTIKRDNVEVIVPVVQKTGKTDYDKMKTDFNKLKKAGKVNTLGVTVHTNDVPAVCREVIDAGIFDMILTMYQPARVEAINKELPRALKQNIGTMSMKTFNGITDETRSTATVVLADGVIHTILKGIRTMSDLDNFLAAVKPAAIKSPPSGGVQARIDPSVCGGCGGCAACPQGIDIQEIMRCTTYYSREPALAGIAADTYRQIPRLATIENCRDCGLCEELCPRGLSIRQNLKLAHQTWAYHTLA